MPYDEPKYNTHTVMNIDSQLLFKHTEHCAEEQIFHPLS